MTTAIIWGLILATGFVFGIAMRPSKQESDFETFVGTPTWRGMQLVTLKQLIELSEKTGQQIKELRESLPKPAIKPRKTPTKPHKTTTTSRKTKK